jgi:hypothetical protein
MPFQWAKCSALLRGVKARPGGLGERSVGTAVLVVAEGTWGRVQPLRRIYEVDPLICPRCGAMMRVIAFITEPRAIHAIVRQVGPQSARWPRATEFSRVVHLGRVATFPPEARGGALAGSPAGQEFLPPVSLPVLPLLMPLRHVPPRVSPSGARGALRGATITRSEKGTSCP